MAYLLDPRRGNTCSRTSRCGTSHSRCSSPDAEPGTLDLDGEIEIDQTGRRALAALQLAAVLEAALDRA